MAVCSGPRVVRHLRCSSHCLASQSCTGIIVTMAATTASMSFAVGQIAGSTILPRTDVCAVRSSTKIAPLTSSFAGVSLQAAAAVAAPRFARDFKACTSAAYAADVDQEDSYGSTAAPPPAAGAKLYVGNLPFNVDSESLAEIFQGVGTVELVEVIYDRDTGRSRGFAFVTMSSVEDAEAAIDRLNGSELGGRMMRVNFPQQAPRPGDRPTGDRPMRESRDSAPMGAAGSGNKLYVGNLSWGMDDMGLEDLFAEFGKVMEAKVVMDRETGRSRGFGFVTYSSPSEGGEAVNSLNGVEVDGRMLRVSVANDRPPTRGRY